MIDEVKQPIPEFPDVALETMLLAYGRMARDYVGLTPHEVNERQFVILQCNVNEEEGYRGGIYHMFWRLRQRGSLDYLWSICFFLDRKTPEDDVPKFRLRPHGRLYSIDLQRFDGSKIDFLNDMTLLKMFGE